MPIYNYYCKECDHEEEHLHGMDDHPEYVCKDCNVKLKIKIGMFEYTIGTGGTRNRSYRERYGNKKKRDSLPTPNESALEKASVKRQEIGQKQYDPSNPYGNL